MQGIEQMLVLTRLENEEIIINENIIVKIMHIQGNRVAIGIDAPREVSVHRKEVQEKIDHYAYKSN